MAPMRELSDGSLVSTAEEVEVTQLPALTKLQGTPALPVGNRVLSALAAPVVTPGGEQLGTVIVLRDITARSRQSA